MNVKKFICLIMSVLLVLSFAACSEKDDTNDDTEPEVTTGSDNGDNQSTDNLITTVDVFLFAGGANMSGRGDAASATQCDEGIAFEFKAISDPTRLYPMTGSFGTAENSTGKINDTDTKSGGMVPAFCKAYYEATERPIVAVSCSDGNSMSGSWKAGQGKTEDAIARLEAATSYIESSSEYELGHVYAVWLQGEADGDSSLPADSYIKNMKVISAALTRRGVEKIFVVQIGNYSGEALRYSEIQQAQRDLCEQEESFVLISDILPTLDAYLHDGYLYSQEAYELLGADAGGNAARYVLSPSTYKEPDRRENAYDDDLPYDGPEINLPILPF